MEIEKMTMLEKLMVVRYMIERGELGRIVTIGFDSQYTTKATLYEPFNHSALNENGKVVIA